MAFDTIEKSNDNGRPIYLYAFIIGAATFRYSAADQDIVLGGYNWKATSISDDGVRVTGDANSDTLTISAPANIAPVTLFAGTPPSQPIICNIFHYHEGDPEAVLSYSGEMTQVSFGQPGTVNISCLTIALSMERDGLRLGWQRNCPYALYDPHTCAAPKPNFAVGGMVMEVRPGQIVVSGLDGIADGYMDGGFFEWEHPLRGVEVRGIETQVGDVLTVFGLSDGLYYGLNITMLPGCPRTTDACANKFNNLDNYGGAPDMPGKSPFDGDPVF